MWYNYVKNSLLILKMWTFGKDCLKCRIDQHGVIKVANNGLKDDMYGTNYYRRNSEVKSEEKVPIRWMAPESPERDIYIRALTW